MEDGVFDYDGMTMRRGKDTSSVKTEGNERNEGSRAMGRRDEHIGSVRQGDDVKPDGDPIGGTTREGRVRGMGAKKQRELQLKKSMEGRRTETMRPITKSMDSATDVLKEYVQKQNMTNVERAEIHEFARIVHDASSDGRG